MKEIYQLVSLLRPHLKWNCARVILLAQFMLALGKVKSLNLMRVVDGFAGTAQPCSSYKRLPRFLRHFDLKPDTIAPLLIKLIAQCPPWTVSIDRTHWKLGMTHVNLLVLSINWHNVAVPLF